MGIKTTKNKIIIFPGIVHKFARLVLPISAIFMLINYHGEIFLIISLIIFFIALIDYYGYFIIMLNKLKKGEVLLSADTVREVHLNSSLSGIKVLMSEQKLLPQKRNL